MMIRPFSKSIRIPHPIRYPLRFRQAVRKMKFTQVMLRLGTGIGCVLLAGCLSLAEHWSPKKVEQSLPKTFRQADGTESANSREHRADSWWEAFQDPSLHGFIQTLRAQNADLAAAEARVHQSHAVLSQSRSGLWPQLLGDAAARSRRDSINQLLFPTELREYERYQLGAAASWELDLWGRLRGTVKRNALLAEGEEDLRKDAALSLEANLVRQIFAWRSAKAELAILEDAIHVRQEDLDLEQARLELGTGVEVDVSRSKVALNTAMAAAEAARRSVGKLEHAIAILLGLAPSEFDPSFSSGDLNSRSLPVIPPGLPASLLIQRPDLRAAEKQVQAAALQVGIRKVDFLPRISLTGTGGVASLKTSNLFQPESTWFDIGPQLDVPLFQAGARGAAVRQAEAAWHEALAQYRSQWLTAVREVDDALLDIKSLGRELAIQRDAVTAASETSSIARLRHERGLASYFEVVEAERDRLTAKRAENALLGEQFAATVSLIQALGGPW